MKKNLILLGIVLFVLSGCGYKLGNMVVGGIKTLALAPVKNSTSKVFIEETAVTNSLIQQFNRDGAVKIVSEDIADAVIAVDVIKYEQSAQSYTDKDVGEYFRILLTANVSVTDRQGKVLFKSLIVGEAKYEADLDPKEAERLKSREAIKDLCTDIVREIVEGGGF